MSLFLPKLSCKKEVDEVIKTVAEKVLVLRFGRDEDFVCMQLDEILSKTSHDLSNMTSIYLVDVDQVPVYTRYFDINYIPSTVFFFNGQHMKVDYGRVLSGLASRTLESPAILQHHHLKVLSAGMKTYDIPPDFSDVVLLEKPKLKFLNKVPNLKKAKKEMKKLRDIQGPANTANTFRWGQYGILAMGGGYLHWGHMEMMRLTINRRMDSRTTFARWRINAPYKPITRKGLGQRMGGGKGAIDHYVTPVKCGRLIVEVGGHLELGEVESVLKEVAKKLPFPAKVVSRESLAAMQQEQAEREANNQNPWTFERVVRSNMLGIRKVLSPFDLHNHGRYTGKFFNPERV